MTTSKQMWGTRALRTLLGSETRAKVLTWLVLHPEQPIFLRDLARHCGLSVTPVHRQLGKLEEIGVVQSERVGNAKRYRLSPRFPALGAIKGLIEATTGFVPRLRERLQRPDIDVAFIFGSGARGKEEAASDVDLFVVGDIDGLVLSQVVRELERQVGKEIDVIHWSAADLARQMDEPSSFLSAVIRQPKVFLKGDEDDLRRIAGQ
jgi:predicted nucleotidyltransferase